LESRSIAIEAEHDIAIARNEVRAIAASFGFRLTDQTRLATVTSELARNIIKYAKRGRLIIGEAKRNFASSRGLQSQARGLRLIFEDKGPGIPDMAAAMRDGYTTGGGLGKGLPGSRRLVDEFTLESAPGEGTRITVVRWIT
jgi:serine/threonine-protein kinase RsbT